MTKEQFTAQVLSAEEMLYKVAMAMLRHEDDALDAIQNAVLRAYERLDTLKKEEYFRTWITRILINVCNRQLRSRKKTAAYHETQQAAASPQEAAEVRAAVEGLPMKLRQVVVLYYMQDFSTKEIASILRIPKGTVLSRLSRARELLKAELDD